MAFTNLAEDVAHIFDEAQSFASDLTSEHLRASSLRFDSFVALKVTERVARASRPWKHLGARAMPYVTSTPSYERVVCAHCGGFLEARPGVRNLTHLGTPRAGCSTRRAA